MKLLTLIIMLAISTSLFSQQTTDVNTDYLKKSKRQKTTAWILVGGGLLSTVIGSVQFNSYWLQYSFVYCRRKK